MQELPLGSASVAWLDGRKNVLFLRWRGHGEKTPFQLLDLMIPKECGAVPMDAATRADLIDLMARVLAAVFHEEGRTVNDRSIIQSQNQTGASGSQGDRLPSAIHRQTSTTE